MRIHHWMSGVPVFQRHITSPSTRLHRGGISGRLPWEIAMTKASAPFSHQFSQKSGTICAHLEVKMKHQWKLCHCSHAIPKTGVSLFACQNPAAWCWSHQFPKQTWGQRLRILKCASGYFAAFFTHCKIAEVETYSSANQPKDARHDGHVPWFWWVSFASKANTIGWASKARSSSISPDYID